MSLVRILNDLAEDIKRDIFVYLNPLYDSLPPIKDREQFDEWWKKDLDFKQRQPKITPETRFLVELQFMRPYTQYIIDDVVVREECVNYTTHNRCGKEWSLSKSGWKSGNFGSLILYNWNRGSPNMIEAIVIGCGGWLQMPDAPIASGTWKHLHLKPSKKECRIAFFTKHGKDGMHREIPMTITKSFVYKKTEVWQWACPAVR